MHHPTDKITHIPRLLVHQLDENGRHFFQLRTRANIKMLIIYQEIIRMVSKHNDIAITHIMETAPICVL